MDSTQDQTTNDAPDGVRRPRLGLPPWPVTIALPIAHFATILLSYGLHLTSLWVVNAILLVALIRNPVATWPVLAALTAAADGAAWLVQFGASLGVLISMVVDVAIPVLIAAALHRFADNRRWFFSIRWMIQFVLFSVLAMALVIPLMLAASLLLSDAPIALGRLAMRWLSMVGTGSLGVVLATPLLLAWTEPALRSGLGRRRALELLGLSIILVGISCLAFATSLPVLFLVFPFLALMTLRGGLIGASTGAIIATGVGAWYTARGLGPVGALSSLDTEQQMLLIQVYFLAAIFSTLPLAVILTLRQKLAGKLHRQHAISDAALNTMAEGLCMFDARQRLITCNARYAELFELPSPLLTTGTPFAEILRYQVSRGSHAELPAAYVRELIADAETRPSRSELELPDGRVIEMHRRTLDGGGWLATYDDVTDSRRAASRIAYLASHDPLTDLPNRTHFGEKLQRTLTRSASGPGLALHCLDLDRFKEVNDTLGHAVGDELLRQVADRLRIVTGDGGFVTRLGGDEFAILQYRPRDADAAGAFAAKVVETLSEPYRILGHEVLIGASAGIARAPRDAIDPNDLLQKGDLALYRAKAEGRNTFRFFEAGMDTVLRDRRQLESDLRAAIQHGEFELYYQPILDLKSGAIGSFEALLRWHHPTRGLIEPNAFIGTAEETGLILPIGNWVIRQACRDAAQWPETIKVAVNLSPLQFRSSALAATVASAVASAGLARGRLELEVTETVLLQDSDAVLKTLEQLRALGVSVAMDDFGTGYSSLSYLRNFSFDKIKIDRSFVEDLGNEQGLAIVHATLELSSRLGMTTTAEGVETAEQLAILEAEGCTNIQGHFIGRPLPACHAARIIRQFGAPELGRAGSGAA